MRSAARMLHFSVTHALIAGALLVGGCAAGEKETAADASDTIPIEAADSPADAMTTAYESRVDAMEKSAPPGLDPCTVQRHVSQALDTITRWPRPLLGGRDDCVLAMLDSLAEGYVASGDERYLAALDSCQSYSDGYVSEYFWELSKHLLEKRPADLVGYLYARRADRSPLESSLKQTWQMEFDESSDSNAIRERVLADVRRSVPLDGLDADEKRYFDEMLRDARLVR